MHFKKFIAKLLLGCKINSFIFCQLARFFLFFGKWSGISICSALSVALGVTSSIPAFCILCIWSLLTFKHPTYCARGYFLTCSDLLTLSIIDNNLCQNSSIHRNK